MTIDWPPLPTAVYSPLGDFAVVVKKIPGSDFGEVDFHTRTITITTGLLPVTQWHTLAHEFIHVSLHESGLSELLADEHEELLCTSIGFSLAAAIGAGFLTVRK